LAALVPNEIVGLFGENFCIKNVSFQDEEKSLKSRFSHKLPFSISTKRVKKSIASFKQHLNYLSIDAKVYNK